MFKEIDDTLTEEEIQMTVYKMDKDGDEKIKFNEFLDIMIEEEEKY